MNWQKDPLSVLQDTSRTFYIPISRLPPLLQEAVASAYLCMRAIDEVEDHPGLDNATKARLLHRMSQNFQAAVCRETIADDWFAEFSDTETLEEVTLRVGEWAKLAPERIGPRIWDATAAMADRMAFWAERNWRIETEAELDQYTFGVAGAVGLLLSDLWAWYDGTQTHRVYAIGFGRGLQAVNILRNYKDDGSRGVDFFSRRLDIGTNAQLCKTEFSLSRCLHGGLTLWPSLGFLPNSSSFSPCYFKCISRWSGQTNSQCRCGVD